jgi:hypothetical protein
MDSLCGEASELHGEVDDMMVCHIQTMDTCFFLINDVISFIFLIIF